MSNPIEATSLTVQSTIKDVPYGGAYRAVVEREEGGEWDGELNSAGYFVLQNPEQVLLFTGDPQSPQDGDVLWAACFPNDGDWEEIGPEDLAGDATYQVTRAKLIEAAEKGDALTLLNMELAADTGLGRYSLEQVRGDLVASPELREEYRQAWAKRWPKQAADLGISGEELAQMLVVCDGDVEVMLSLAERVPRPSNFLSLYNDSGLGLTIDQAVVLSSNGDGDPDRIRQLVQIFGSLEQVMELVEGFGSGYHLEPEEIEEKIAMGFNAQQAVQLASVDAEDLRLLVELPGADAEQVAELLTATASGYGTRGGQPDWFRAGFEIGQITYFAEVLPGVSLQQARWLAGWRIRNDDPRLNPDQIGQLLQEEGGGTIQGLIEYLDANPAPRGR